MRGRGGNGRRRRRDVVVSQNGANHCSVVLISTVAAGKMCSLLYIAVPLNDRPRTKTTPRWRCPHYILYHPLLRPSRSFTFTILISFFLIFSAVAWYSFQPPPPIINYLLATHNSSCRGFLYISVIYFISFGRDFSSFSYFSWWIYQPASSST